MKYRRSTAIRRARGEGREHTVCDTLDHQIGGVSQQQGSGGSLTFTSQYGIVSISTLNETAIGRCNESSACVSLTNGQVGPKEDFHENSRGLRDFV